MTVFTAMILAISSQESVESVPSEFAPIEMMYRAAAADDSRLFATVAHADLGLFAAPDFVIPMSFVEFQQFSRLCVTPTFVATTTDVKLQGMVTVTVNLQCDSGASGVVSTNFDVWTMAGKVVAFRPQGIQ